MTHGHFCTELTIWLVFLLKFVCIINNCKNPWNLVLQIDNTQHLNTYNNIQISDSFQIKTNGHKIIQLYELIFAIFQMTITGHLKNHTGCIYKYRSGVKVFD